MYAHMDLLFGWRGLRYEERWVAPMFQFFNFFLLCPHRGDGWKLFLAARLCLPLGMEMKP